MSTPAPDPIPSSSSSALNDEQQRALKLLLSGANGFVTGAAFSGKSTLISDYLKARSSSSR